MQNNPVQSVIYLLDYYRCINVKAACFILYRLLQLDSFCAGMMCCNALFLSVKITRLKVIRCV